MVLGWIRCWNLGWLLGSCWLKSCFCEHFVKRFLSLLKSFSHIAWVRADWFSPNFLEMSIFLKVLLPVKTVFLEWAFNWVSSVWSFAIEILEWVRAWLALLCFESRWINLKVSFATPSKLPMIISEVKAIALSTFWLLNSTNSSWVTLFPTILALRDARVHIGIPHHIDYVSNIKLPIDYFFGIVAILVVPDINPDNCHI